MWREGRGLFQVVIRNEGYIHFVGAGRKAQVLGLSWGKIHCLKERSKGLWTHEHWTKGMGQVAVCLPSEGSLWAVSACSGQAFIIASARRLPGVLVPPHRAVIYEEVWSPDGTTWSRAFQRPSTSSMHHHDMQWASEEHPLLLFK